MFFNYFLFENIRSVLEIGKKFLKAKIQNMFRRGKEKNF